jgi:arylformamidase
MSVAFEGFRIVELSHTLLPGEEEYQLEVANRYVEELQPSYAGLRPPGADYIMSEVALWSHVGTHMEAPFHYFKRGADIASVPLAQVVGECCLLDFTDRGVEEAITQGDLEERGADVRRGDIVFVRTDQGNYRTARSHDRPFFAEEAIVWLVERGITCLGVDCSGIERRGLPRQPNHAMLFRHGIPLIEHLAHLDELKTTRFVVVAVPWRVRGLEASPVSVVAFERE